MTIDPVAELTATNFRLSLEVRSLRADLTQMKALRKYEDSLEVGRIKEAYAELETEVVAFRREKMRRINEVKIEEAVVQQTTLSSSVSTDCEIITVLKDQLRSEREKYKALESKYEQLRRDSGDNSTTASGSPLCYRELFSIEKSEQVHIKPKMEEMFKRPTRTQRPLIPLAEVVASAIVTPGPISNQRPTVVKSDASIQRLAKIAKYRGN